MDHCPCRQRDSCCPASRWRSRLPIEERGIDHQRVSCGQEHRLLRGCRQGRRRFDRGYIRRHESKLNLFSVAGRLERVDKRGTPACALFSRHDARVRRTIVERAILGLLRPIKCSLLFISAHSSCVNLSVSLMNGLKYVSRLLYGLCLIAFNRRS